jgi:hypothetical protein
MPPIPADQTRRPKSQASQQRPAPSLPLLLSITETQRELGDSSRSAVYEFIASGDLETVHLGRAVRVTRESLLALIERCADRKAPRHRKGPRGPP